MIATAFSRRASTSSRRSTSPRRRSALSTGHPCRCPTARPPLGKPTRPSRGSPETSRASRPSSRSITTTRASSSRRSSARTARAWSCTTEAARRAGPSTPCTAARSERRSRSPRFRARPPNGTWTLEVGDEVPGIEGRIRNFAVRLTAGQPPAAIPRGASARVLPVVGKVQGTKFFLSDARVLNPGDEPKTLSLFYVPQGAGGSQAVRATRTVGPGEVLALDDVVGTEFGYDQSIGQLTLIGPDPRFLATSRAYTRGRQRHVRCVRAVVPVLRRHRPGRDGDGERPCEGPALPHERGIHGSLGLLRDRPHGPLSAATGAFSPRPPVARLPTGASS